MHLYVQIMFLNFVNILTTVHKRINYVLYPTLPIYCAEMCYKKFALVVRREQKLQRVAEKRKSKGAKKVLIIRKDLSERLKGCSVIFQSVITDFGSLDILVSNA